MLGWLSRWRRARTLARRAIPEAMWRRTLQRFAFLTWRPEADIERLRELTTLFLDAKEFSGAHGLVVDDVMAVAIAAQACLPVLHLGLGWYDGFVGIVVHEDVVVAQRVVTDEDGVVHAYEEELAGEAMQGGPVMLSWSDVRDGVAGFDAGYNVVIHEFAHVLDMRDGLADGIPPLADRVAGVAWAETLQHEYAVFCDAVDRGEPHVLDTYAAEAPEEFFAVACEAFFVTPQAFRDQLPAFHAQLSAFFRQDPSLHAPRPARSTSMRQRLSTRRTTPR